MARSAALDTGKRDFARGPVPGADNGAVAHAGRPLSFVVEMHDARRLHFDFRLQLDGVLMSWAVMRGPSLDPTEKRLAVRTQDHPLASAAGGSTRRRSERRRHGPWCGTRDAGCRAAIPVRAWSRAC